MVLVVWLLVARNIYSVFFIGVFATLYASISGKTTAFSMLITDAFRHVLPKRRDKYGKEFHHDPMHKWFMLFILVTPLVWSVPGMPDFATGLALWVAFQLGVDLFSL